MKPTALCLMLLLAALTGFGQEKWDLRKCVEYAMSHNISVKQQDVQARLAGLQYRQSQQALYPSAQFSTNTGYSSGRNQNPVTFGLITQGYFFNTYGLQAGVDLFNWGSKKYTVAANQFATKAAFANVDKLRNDVALNVAGAYLQALLGLQQVEVSRIQIGQTAAQLSNTRKLVEAGSLPELNAVQLEAQLATDSSNFYTAQNNTTQAFLLLKAYLGLDAGTPFDISTPPVELIPLDDMATLQPENVYALAIKNLPQQRVDDYLIRSAEQSVRAARGAMYPTVSAFAQLGTNFNSQATKVTGATPIVVPVGTVNVNGTAYDVFPKQPQFIYSSDNIGYISQIGQFFRQSVGFTINVPIANGGVLRGAYLRSRLNLENYHLQKDQDDLNLKQDIYKAYSDAVTSFQKFNAAARNVAANERAFEFATKRYNVGLLNTIDLITTQNNLYTARLQRLLAQYDYVFKMKVLEFYKGQGIRL